MPPLGLSGAAGLFLFRNLASDIQYMLLRTSYTPDKYWTPPKGYIVQGDDPVKIAMEATQRATGYTTEDIDVYHKYRRCVKYSVNGHDKEIMFYLAQLTNKTKAPVLTKGYDCVVWAETNRACSLLRFRDMKKLTQDMTRIIVENEM
ncbi:bis(5'-nucleosyl)-tetraphosphatase [asymmetrical]-like [Adelges cooleyi]|uniref:bis(5'-nucleosyl)-tetraphosphatase [asymmetrical]-like n=1 Tax=Adelges cooleyi TaxID=133065 RepID=UPI0021800527|nr:bis(5'-nucleosyl)-tetraphosphatase [asymmetrical]-like [Adelges cooleyi]